MSDTRSQAKSNSQSTSASPRCAVCGDTGIVHYDDAHGEARNAPCHCHVVDFKCTVCGVECPIAPADGSGAVCEEHCPDHIYIHMGSDGTRCRTCFAEAPEDWYE